MKDQDFERNIYGLIVALEVGDYVSREVFGDDYERVKEEVRKEMERGE